MSWATGQNPPRPAYPKEVLKHRFMPYGSLAPSKEGIATMDVDSIDETSPDKTTATVEEKPAKTKKRKTDTGEAKKSKKAKKAE